MPTEFLSGLLFPLFRIFFRFGFNPEKTGKVLNSSNRYAMGCIICVISIRKHCSNISISFITGCFLERRNNISNVSKKRYAEIGSPRQASLSKLKYWVVVPPFITPEIWSFNTFNTCNEISAKSKFSQDGTKKIMKKTYSVPIATRNPSMFN